MRLPDNNAGNTSSSKAMSSSPGGNANSAEARGQLLSHPKAGATFVLASVRRRTKERTEDEQNNAYKLRFAVILTLSTVKSLLREQQ
ncbi:unnamed protein product [Protopolystoma xenopodis]|uniref:Uncharacterized protein n=1 Tax=Protopolystoma xenopodis TaxID=117903 RepID=A0A448WD95_9PLAT|nr:unnamed protein product [Protopolystoma xenopodis]